MGGAPGAEGVVAPLAEGVVEHGDACRVVEGVAEFMLDGEAADHPFALAGGDLDRPLPGATPRGHSAGETERAVVPTADEVEGLGEQGAGHVDAHPGDGEEDGEVVGAFLRAFLGAFLGGMSLGEGLEQFTDVALRLGQKLVGVSGLGEQGGERPDRGFGDAGGDRERGGLAGAPSGCWP